MTGTFTDRQIDEAALAIARRAVGQTFPLLEGEMERYRHQARGALEAAAAAAPAPGPSGGPANRLHWFSDVDGHSWYVYLAASEAEAWAMLRQEPPGYVTREEANVLSVEGNPVDDDLVMELDAVTDLGSGNPGKVAWIRPLDVNFSIRKQPEPMKPDAVAKGSHP